MNLNLEAFLKGDIRRVSHVNRYSSFPVLRKENVAEHSFWVALLSLSIADDLGLTLEERFLVVSRALVHDIDESITGDFIRSIKHSDPELLSRLDAVSGKVVSDFDDLLGTQYLERWDNAKEPGLLGDIVRLVDFAVVLAYLIEEERMGNRLLKPIANDLLQNLTKFGANAHNDLFGYVQEVWGVAYRFTVEEKGGDE